MSERLGALDASFLYLETPTTAMHVGGVATFAVPAGGSDYYPRLIRRISDRIGAAPRYRQKLCPVPGGLANPVWVDDPDFDLAYHVRHSTLPRPGSDAQLRERVARVHSRQLDRSRPLWELHLVEGLSDQRFALIIKIHHAMVDGIGGLDIGRLFFDQVPTAAPSPTPAAPPPSAGYLIVGAALDLACRPMTALAGLPRDWAGAQLAVAGTLRDSRGRAR